MIFCPVQSSGIKTCGLFNIQYDNMCRQIISTPNGNREYAVFSAYIDN